MRPSIKTYLPLLLIAGMALPVPVAESAESVPCGEREQMLGHLAGKYQETPVAMGMATNGTLVEVLASTSGSSFTIVYTTPDGLTCLMAAGSNWEVLTDIAGIKA